MSADTPPSGQPSAPDFLTLLPPCALNCLTLTEPNTTCTLSSPPSCRCEDAIYNALLSQCISQDCTIRESLTTRNVTAGLCGVEPHVDHSGKPIFAIFTALAVLFVGLRFAVRRVRTVKVWWDDVCSLVGAAVVVAMFGLTMKLYDLGMGSDMWSVPHENITTIFLYTYITMPLYSIARLVSRISILLFYMRIFDKTPGRRLRICVLVFDIITGLGLSILVAIPCRPVGFFWVRWDREHDSEGQCIDFYAEALSMGITQLLIDVAIILLPIMWISRLQLKIREKLMSCFLFSVGLCVIGASAARVANFGKWIHGRNPTVDTLDFTILSHVELCLAIICACLPSVAPLVRSAFKSKYTPTILKSTQKTTKSTYPGYHRHSTGATTDDIPPSGRFYALGRSEDSTVLLERIRTESSDNVSSAAKIDEKMSKGIGVAYSTTGSGDDVSPEVDEERLTGVGPQKMDASKSGDITGAGTALFTHYKSYVSSGGSQDGYVQAPRSAYIP